jgi:cardiolipin synthase
MPEVDFKFYTQTGEAWEAMLADLREAKETIDIEQYIFNYDAIGQQFIDILIEKAQTGLKIRLLCDMVGSHSFYHSAIPAVLRHQGVEVRFFNPISPWRIANFTSNFFRDHRKVLVVDSKIVHLGGVGIAEYMKAWRDTHMRLIGPIAPDIKVSFESVWENAGRSFPFGIKQPHHFVKRFNLLTNAPGLRQRAIYQALIAEIRGAQKYIYLTTPYFIPDARLFRVLRLAARRGVDVRIIVPTVADHFLIDHARESFYATALRSGIKIYLYKHIMMHAKTAVIDDMWAMAGSFNLDNLSSLFNHEANISSDDAGFISELKSHFIEDLTNCNEVHYGEWIIRPFYKKILELVTWPFHGIM